MFRLATFGGLSLIDDRTPDIAIPRRRLAVLALLAQAGDRGLTRDKLVAYLWPDSSADAARHSLEQLLYSVRRQCGAFVFAGTDPLRLNSAVIASDIAEFESALARGADAEAVALYSGPFLDGFYLKNADEFGRWVEEERSRLGKACAGALERLAERAARCGDWPGAVSSWRALVALDRLSARNASGLIRALAAAGDRPEALRTASAYESLVRQELDIPLEPSLAALVQSLRSDRSNSADRRAAERGPIEDLLQSATPSPQVTTGASFANSDVAHMAPLARANRNTRWRTKQQLLGVMLVLVVWLALGLRTRQHRSAVAARARVAVTVFENRTGDPRLDNFGIMVTDYARSALAATGLIDVVAPAFDLWQAENARPASPVNRVALAKQTGATIIVTGAYYKQGDSLLFTGQGIDAKSGRLIFTFDSVKASVEARAEAIEQVRRHVTIAIAMHVDPALTAWAGNEGKPPMRFDAYQEFADGMTAFVRGIAGQSEVSRDIGGFNVASTHLRRAFQLDSTYYVAALWWFWSRENGGDRFGADSVLQILEPHRTSMSPYERALYDYNVAVVHGTPEERYQLDEKLVAFAPASEFLFCRARDALESGHPVEAMDVLERLDDTYSWIRLMAPPPGFRVRALVQLREYTKAADLARQIRKESPGEISSAYPALDALRALNRLDDVERMVGRSAERDTEPEPPVNLMLYAGLHLQAAGRTENAQHLFARALAAASSLEPGNRMLADENLLIRGRSLYYLQRWDEARTAFEQLALRTPGPRLNRRALLFLGSLAARRADLKEVSRLRQQFHSLIVIPAAELYFDARVAALLGQRDRALELLANAVARGAQAEEYIMDGDPAPSMDPDFADLRGSRAFKTAVGRW